MLLGIGKPWFVVIGELGIGNWETGIGCWKLELATMATICMVGTRVPRVRIPRQSTSNCGHARLVAPLLLREAPAKQSFAPFDAFAPFAKAITRMPRPTRAAKASTFSFFDVTPMLHKECSARPKHNQCHVSFNGFRFSVSRFPIPNFHLKLIRFTHSPMR